MKKILTLLVFFSFTSVVAKDKYNFIDRITNEKNWTIQKIIKADERAQKIMAL
jgi:hypothetical protein